MLVERLWPQPPAAAAPARRSVTFAGAAAPAASAPSAAQADPLQWRSKALDRLVIALAAPELLSGHPAAPQLLGRLLAGVGPLPLIGESAALSALDSLHQALRAAASPAGDDVGQ